MPGPLGETRDIYNRIRKSCDEPTFIHYAEFGGKGVKFELPPFEEFLFILGTRPARHRLVRIDDTKNYEIGNVRWELDEKIPVKVWLSAEQIEAKRKLKWMEKHPNEPWASDEELRQKRLAKEQQKWKEKQKPCPVLNLAPGSRTPDCSASRSAIERVRERLTRDPDQQPHDLHHAPLPDDADARDIDWTPAASPEELASRAERLSKRFGPVGWGRK
jgi:hypothetical protein